MKAVKLYKINWNLDNMDPEERREAEQRLQKRETDRLWGSGDGSLDFILPGGSRVCAYGSMV